MTFGVGGLARRATRQKATVTLQVRSRHASIFIHNGAPPRRWLAA